MGEHSGNSVFCFSMDILELSVLFCLNGYLLKIKGFAIIEVGFKGKTTTGHLRVYVLFYNCCKLGGRPVTSFDFWMAHGFVPLKHVFSIVQHLPAQRKQPGNWGFSPNNSATFSAANVVLTQS